MPIYTFYPTRSDGVALSFSAIALADDPEAFRQAELVAREHPSCCEVIVWEGERRLESLRAPTPARELAWPDIG